MFSHVSHDLEVRLRGFLLDKNIKVFDIFSDTHLCNLLLSYLALFSLLRTLFPGTSLARYENFVLHFFFQQRMFCKH